ncbi:hypothetical protein DV515_00005430 [Chloebia gouldiae]|uniref:Uncharacterized protein n=1 Tax=Chloebia gouldiae TaxID=44316 RepID=A0A3L8SMT7_CHLGU|nr:hypothetical protein DV515_00005430 [Chloebia gouldiae]
MDELPKHTMFGSSQLPSSSPPRHRGGAEQSCLQHFTIYHSPQALVKATSPSYPDREQNNPVLWIQVDTSSTVQCSHVVFGEYNRPVIKKQRSLAKAKASSTYKAPKRKI